jgi:hypothetical protein
MHTEGRSARMHRNRHALTVAIRVDLVEKFSCSWLLVVQPCRQDMVAVRRDIVVVKVASAVHEMVKLGNLQRAHCSGARGQGWARLAAAHKDGRRVRTSSNCQRKHQQADQTIGPDRMQRGRGARPRQQTRPGVAGRGPQEGICFVSQCKHSWRSSTAGAGTSTGAPPRARRRWAGTGARATHAACRGDRSAAPQVLPAVTTACSAAAARCQCWEARCSKLSSAAVRAAAVRDSPSCPECAAAECAPAV